jgi:hypothetical protein
MTGGAAIDAREASPMSAAACLTHLRAFVCFWLVPCEIKTAGRGPCRCVRAPAWRAPPARIFLSTGQGVFPSTGGQARIGRR